MAEALKVSVEQLSELGSPDVAEELEQALRDRAACKSEIDRLEAEVRSINGRIIPLMLSLNIGQVTDPALGSLIYKSGVNRSITKDRLINALLAHSMGAEEVADVVKEVTKETPYETVEFRKARSDG